MERLVHFPDVTSLEQLRRDGVRYVIVHQTGYPAEIGPKVIHELAFVPELQKEGTFDDGSGPAHVYVLR